MYFSCQVVVVQLCLEFRTAKIGRKMDWSWNKHFPSPSLQFSCMSLYLCASNFNCNIHSSPLLGVLPSTLLSFPFLQLSTSMSKKKKKLNKIFAEYHYIRLIITTWLLLSSIPHNIIIAMRWSHPTFKRQPTLSRFLRQLLDQHPTLFTYTNLWLWHSLQFFFQEHPNWLTSSYSLPLT